MNKNKYMYMKVYNIIIIILYILCYLYNRDFKFFFYSRN